MRIHLYITSKIAQIQSKSKIRHIHVYTILYIHYTTRILYAILYYSYTIHILHHTFHRNIAIPPLPTPDPSKGPLAYDAG